VGDLHKGSLFVVCEDHFHAEAVHDLLNEGDSGSRHGIGHAVIDLGPSLLIQYVFIARWINFHEGLLNTRW